MAHRKLTSKHLVSVWQDTEKYFRNFDIKTIRSTKYLSSFEFPPLTTQKYPHTVFTVTNDDTLDSAIYMQSKGFDPLVLNMASEVNPGGGVQRGSNAQEECLFRRTNLHLFLPKHQFYPIGYNAVVYSKNVDIIKDSDYNRLKPNTALSFIACPAIRNPKLIKGRLTPDDHHLTEQKIRLILDVAYLNNHDSLVLGALGCGAFHNPPKVIANLFKKVLKDFNGCFKHIDFAVQGRNYDVHDNYTIFNEILHEFNEIPSAI